MSATTKQITRAIKAVIDRNSSLPIIKSVYFTGNTIIATDLETRLYIPFKVPEPFIANAVQVCDVFDAFGINFIPSLDKDRKIHFRSGNRTIKVSETHPVDEFPGLPDMDEFSTLGDLSERDIENILTASNFTGNDDLRMALQHVAIIGCEIAATDTHRLFSIETDSGIDGVLVKRKTWKLLGEFAGPWTVEQNKTNDRFTSSEGVVVIQRRCDERHPNYRAVIPQDNPIQLTLARKELSEALKQGKKFAGESQRVDFEIGEGVILRFTDLDMDREYSTELKLASISNCENFTIGFHIGLMEGILKHCPEALVFQMSAPNRAAIICDHFLQMPVIKHF